MNEEDANAVVEDLPEKELELQSSAKVEEKFQWMTYSPYILLLFLTLVITAIPSVLLIAILFTDIFYQMIYFVVILFKFLKDVIKDGFETNEFLKFALQMLWMIYSYPMNIFIIAILIQLALFLFKTIKDKLFSIDFYKAFSKDLRRWSGPDLAYGAVYVIFCIIVICCILCNTGNEANQKLFILALLCFYIALPIIGIILLIIKSWFYLFVVKFGCFKGAKKKAKTSWFWKMIFEDIHDDDLRDDSPNATKANLYSRIKILGIVYPRDILTQSYFSEIVSNTTNSTKLSIMSVTLIAGMALRLYFFTMDYKNDNESLNSFYPYSIIVTVIYLLMFPLLIHIDDFTWTDGLLNTLMSVFSKKDEDEKKDEEGNEKEVEKKKGAKKGDKDDIELDDLSQDGSKSQKKDDDKKSKRTEKDNESTKRRKRRTHKKKDISEQNFYMGDSSESKNVSKQKAKESKDAKDLTDMDEKYVDNLEGKRKKEVKDMDEKYVNTLEAKRKKELEDMEEKFVMSLQGRARRKNSDDIFEGVYHIEEDDKEMFKGAKLVKVSNAVVNILVFIIMLVIIVAGSLIVIWETPLRTFSRNKLYITNMKDEGYWDPPQANTSFCSLNLGGLTISQLSALPMIAYFTQSDMNKEVREHNLEIVKDLAFTNSIEGDETVVIDTESLETGAAILVYKNSKPERSFYVINGLHVKGDWVLLLEQLVQQYFYVIMSVIPYYEDIYQFLKKSIITVTTMLRQASGCLSLSVDFAESVKEDSEYFNMTNTILVGQGIGGYYSKYLSVIQNKKFTGISFDALSFADTILETEINESETVPISTINVISESSLYGVSEDLIPLNYIRSSYPFGFIDAPSAIDSFCKTVAECSTVEMQQSFCMMVDSEYFGQEMDVNQRYWHVKE